MAQERELRLRSASRTRPELLETGRRAGEDLADWLQEAGKRPWMGGPPSIEPAGVSAASAKLEREPLSRGRLQDGRGLVVLAVLSIAYLQYYYLDVMVHIGSLPEVIVFVPVAGRSANS